ncbi:hypothetical protein PR048_005324 [Dryococelus australis]|uniref:DDE Tnp4 domain-containing protein n=1 Tax=Dryococelus australis TaxID=614101 RepID=A0ABQ9I7X5_9NEOP|nr:hypothetical protein PR048_005324 [Dryococelus australis]
MLGGQQVYMMIVLRNITLSDWLSLERVVDPAVNRFNGAHKSTRRLLENSFGILKEKFPCLKHLRITLIFAAKVFKCCTALCNIAQIEDNLQTLQIETDEEITLAEIDNNGIHPHPVAQQRLEQLINHFR